MQLYCFFIFASAVLLIIPGPTVLTVISYSLSHGRRSHVPLVAAVALGDATALCMSLLGLGAVLAASAFWFALVKWVGGLYLLYLGVRMLLGGFSPANEFENPVPATRRRLFLDTYTVTALNPKSIMFFVAFLPQFVDHSGNTVGQLWLLASTFVLLAAANALAYSLFASTARRVLATSRARKYLQCTGGALLSAAAFWVLLARRPG